MTIIFLAKQAEQQSTLSLLKIVSFYPMIIVYYSWSMQHNLEVEKKERLMEVMESKEHLFGTKAAGVSGRNLSYQTVIKNTMRLQPIKFWAFTYIVAFLIYQFISPTFYLPFFVNIVNLILFPFSAMLMGKLANFFYPSFSFIRAILYPSYKTNPDSSNIFAAVFVLVVKLIIYIMIWHYTFIIGILGLIIAINDVKNLSK
ncbi:hypothetical protein [Siminovitchia fortis]|uniref:hypothetical protein n=2 Tax=Siminovitchia fortis TaxID=254758 RepID=UPI001C931409|nr:hypothetical protein [Siminovitchia fortis]